MAFLEFLVAAAWAWIVTADVFQRIAHWLLMSVTAVRAMYVTVLVVVMVMVVIMVAIRAMNMGVLVHRWCSRKGSNIEWPHYPANAAGQ